jgi:hypothetical protein
MARKVYSPEEQARMDATAKARREASQMVEQEKRNKKLMYIGGAVLIVGVALYLLRKK